MMLNRVPLKSPFIYLRHGIPAWSCAANVPRGMLQGWRMGADFCSQAGGGELTYVQLLIFDKSHTSVLWDRYLRFSRNESPARILPGFNLTKLVAVVVQALCKHSFRFPAAKSKSNIPGPGHSKGPSGPCGDGIIANGQWAGNTKMPNSPRSLGSGHILLAPGNGRRVFCI